MAISGMTYLQELGYEFYQYSGRAGIEIRLRGEYVGTLLNPFIQSHGQLLREMIPMVLCYEMWNGKSKPVIWG